MIVVAFIVLVVLVYINSIAELYAFYRLQDIKGVV